MCYKKNYLNIINKTKFQKPKYEFCIHLWCLVMALWNEYKECLESHSLMGNSKRFIFSIFLTVVSSTINFF